MRLLISGHKVSVKQDELSSRALLYNISVVINAVHLKIAHI